MAAAPSLDDYLNSGKASAVADRPTLALNIGDVSLMFIDAAAAMADRLTGYAARLAKVTYLDGATGDDLTTLADDHWGVQRIAAVKAVTTVTFSRAAATAGAGTISAGTIVATVRDAKGKEVRFLTDAPIVFAGGDLTHTGIATAAVAGAAGNVAANAITRIITSTLWDSSLTVSASALAVGGAEEQSDADLREAVRNKPSTFRRATLSALEYGALQVSTVKHATAIEDITTGLVTLYVSDAAGNGNSAMTAAVDAELEDWRAAGAAVTTLVGVPVAVDVTTALTVRAGAQSGSYSAAVTVAVSAVIGKLKIGETLYYQAIAAAVRALDPVSILDVTVTIRTGVGAFLTQNLTPPAGTLYVAGVITPG